MSVLIKGMEMPKYGDTFKVYLDADGAFLLVDTNDSSRFYTLVEVKPHGDLIDRDAFLEDMNCGLWDWSTVDGVTATTALKQTMSDLREAPTVIEAEGDDG